MVKFLNFLSEIPSIPKEPKPLKNFEALKATSGRHIEFHLFLVWAVLRLLDP